jgi:glutamate synthase (NADPH/NADH) small chain
MKKSIFSPYAAWKNFFKAPTTVRYPREDIQVFERPGASPTYRGLHANDTETCIGCGTCGEICPTDAITMVPATEEKSGPGRKPVKPSIDYGRCCFCGFCVDVCTSGSLTMSRDYIHTKAMPLDKLGMAEVREVAEAFTRVPGGDHADNPGHVTPDELSWLDLKRVKMEEAGPEERADSFLEIVQGFSRQQARREASRCVECEVCVETCPARMEIPAYIRAIWEDDLEEAVRIMYRTNPLPGVCGRICTHKCESVCSVSLRGEPVAIRWLKRYAVDAVAHVGGEEALRLHQQESGARPEKVAVIGSGPSGLAAAYYLGLAGYGVTVFEALPQAGGMMRVGVPAYRLPDEALDRDIRRILDLGVELVTSTRVGADIGFEELSKRYDAAYVATGLHRGRSLGFPAEKTAHVQQAVDLLREFRLSGRIPVKERVLVIGGGNVAMDIARTLARLQRRKYGRVDIRVFCLESEAEIPADLEEVVEAREEGIVINPSYGPRDIHLEGRRVSGAEFVRCVSVFDSEGRFSPRFDEGKRISAEAGMVVEAVGQAADLDFLPEEIRGELKLNEQRRLEISESGQTSLPWLFAGGDIVRGPDAINGIADGHRAARGIDAYLAAKSKAGGRKPGGRRKT